jgi:hypothetical protein
VFICLCRLSETYRRKSAKTNPFRADSQWHCRVGDGLFQLRFSTHKPSDRRLHARILYINKLR